MAAVTEEAVLEALRDVIDPELGYNIVDLGLVYGVTVEGSTVEVVMTMTTPGCPATEYIREGAVERLSALDGVEAVNVEVVWSPPWDPSMMSDEAKAYFGFD
ncbi:MAG: metal-sulfur cluster assembly factor [Firmicutes bacterium]|nr:metal-sulfur cluster assembly factor [Alicyclobacillaceae bacterium]MCL6498142.1 metal-sulfur cluster assembly factor [Bacillota bacterium]